MVASFSRFSIGVTWRRKLFPHLRGRKCILLEKMDFDTSGRAEFNTCPALTADSCKATSDYDKTIALLNGLQTYVSLPVSGHRQSTEIIGMMEKWLESLGHSVDDLDCLKAIHISGTKGKGSTCALGESMLRQYGYRTGLFTSPHLRRARERIRINGRALSPEAFSSHFLSVYGRLQQNSKLPLPGYFHFLTLMAFDVFLKEGVDVAVVEVGVGGEYDATNVLRRPVVCGVSALALDHVALLGNSIDKIAWHKAGIFKRGVPAFTQNQPEEAMRVLRERAAKIDCPLSIVPPFELYLLDNKQPFSDQLGLEGNIQLFNASLALQLVNTWIQTSHSDEIILLKSSSEMAAPFRPSSEMISGLQRCRWPGRFHRINRTPFAYFLDGAHTLASIRICAKWFFTTDTTNSLPCVLVFSTTGPRNSEQFLTCLHDVASEHNQSFGLVVFSPTVPRLPPEPDSAYDVRKHNEQRARCRDMADFWCKSFNSLSNAVDTVDEALGLIQKRFPDGCKVLFTGSLHLVGSTLEALDEPVV